jgi:adenylate cyclase
MAADAERREAAILYAELRNFTKLSEVLAPAKVLQLANDFFSLAGLAVTANGGKVLSVQNDMLVAAFAKADRQEYAGRALASARDLAREFSAMAADWHAQHGIPAAVSSALHIGEAVYGRAGPIGAQQFVAFGDCVSIAERLVHRARAGEVILSLDFVKALGPAAQSLGAEELPALEVPKRAAIPIYGIVLEKRLDFE